MHKSFLFCFIIIANLSSGQKKADWSVYSSFTYNAGNYSEKGNSLSFPAHFVAINEKQFAFGDPTGALTFYVDGKTYSTSRTVFDPFPKGNTSVISGGMTEKVSALFKDTNGTIWLGSSKGLLSLPKATYEKLEGLDNLTGIKGTHYKDETPGMPFKLIQSITGDGKGNIWVAGSKVKGISFIPEGVSRFDGNEWKQFIPVQNADKPITKLTTDSNGVLYGVIGENVVFKFNGADWSFFASPEKVNVLTVDSKNTLYFGGSILYSLNGEKWSPIEVTGLSSEVTSIEFDAISTWVGSQSSGAFQIFPNKAVVHLKEENSPIPSNSIVKISVDKNNRKWFYTNNGWASYLEPQYASDKVEIFNRYTIGYNFEFMEDAVIYNNQLAFAMSDAGLVTFNGSGFSKISKKSEVSHTGLAIDKNGKLYMSTSKYLYSWDGSKIDPWEITEDAVSKRINDVLVDDKNQVWLAHNKGVSKFDGTAWQHFDKKTGLTTNATYALFQDSKNIIWLITNDGISKYDGTAWENFSKKTVGFAISGMKGVAEFNGKLFFSNGWSLVEYDGGAFKEVTSFKRIEGGINHFTMDADGNSWFASVEKGVVKFSNGIFVYYTTEDGLPSNNVNRVFINNKDIWASSGVKPVFEMSATTMGGTGATTATPPTPSAKEKFDAKVKDFEPKFALLKIKG